MLYCYKSDDYLNSFHCLYAKYRILIFLYSWRIVTVFLVSGDGLRLCLRVCPVVKWFVLCATVIIINMLYNLFFSFERKGQMVVKWIWWFSRITSLLHFTRHTWCYRLFFKSFTGYCNLNTHVFLFWPDIMRVRHFKHTLSHISDHLFISEACRFCTTSGTKCFWKTFYRFVF